MHMRSGNILVVKQKAISRCDGIINCFKMADQAENQIRDSQTDECGISKKTYQACIEKLNSLQPLGREYGKSPETGVIVARPLDVTSVTFMAQYLNRCGVTVEEINQLPIIHVAGTKGKGSVCAFTERILREHGLKTGLYTSPHLIEVRERFRINGKPIGYNTFVRHFSEVFNKLEGSIEKFGGEMPAYKQILCIMGFYVFLKEKVDVAVIEVGLGGEYDVTNFIREPVVTGISSLGMDHEDLLGNTITEIAWHKAGILKPGKPAFTVPQPEDAMQVILEKAEKIGTTVQVCVVSSLEEYNLGKHPVKLGIPGKHQQVNATLAIQLCQKFLEITKNNDDLKDTHYPSNSIKISKEEEVPSNQPKNNMNTSQTFVLTEKFLSGLRECYWPGRSQKVTRDSVTYYLDGAHTERSIKCCVEWFLEDTREEEAQTHRGTAKILVFNLKSQKYKPALIRPLLACGFIGAVFCPSYVNDGENSADQSFLANKRSEELCNSQNIKQKYEVLDATLKKSFVGGEDISKIQLSQETEKLFPDRENSNFSLRDQTILTKCVTLPSISSALRWASAGRDGFLSPSNIQESEIPEQCFAVDRIQVLITGSLYLVGGALQLLDPTLAIT